MGIRISFVYWLCVLAELSPRFLLLASFGAYFMPWCLILPVGHFMLVMIFHIYSNPELYGMCCCKAGKFLFLILCSYINIFCFINVTGGRTFNKRFIYYILFYTENAVMVVLVWYKMQPHKSCIAFTLLIMPVGFVCHLSFLLLYYKLFHPNNKIDLWILVEFYFLISIYYLSLFLVSERRMIEPKFDHEFRILFLYHPNDVLHKLPSISIRYSNIETKETARIDITDFFFPHSLHPSANAENPIISNTGIFFCFNSNVSNLYNIKQMIFIPFSAGYKKMLLQNCVIFFFFFAQNIPVKLENKTSKLLHCQTISIYCVIKTSIF